MNGAIEGKPAPHIDLPTDGNGRFALAEARGKPVVVYFYPKDDTSGCTREAQQFSELAGEFAELGVHVVGISPDSVEKHEKFIAKYELKVQLASDSEKQVAQAYGVWVEKSMYGKKYMGVERSSFLISADGVVLRAWRKVKVPGHARAVLEAARAAQEVR